MRNIDDDAVLFGFVRRHYEGEMTEDRLRQVLGHKGYEAEEIDGALSDFWWVHVRTPRVVNFVLVPTCVACVLFLLFLVLFF